MVKTKSNNIITGNLGESLAAKYLSDQGFQIIDRNYRKTYGEIDIIASKNNRVHFVEVKSVSYETIQSLHKSLVSDSWKPEDQVYAFKINQINRTLSVWLLENKYEGDWQIDVIAIRLVPRGTYCTVKYVENIS